MQIVNPENNSNQAKHQTIEQYINDNLQLKTLKIKKFCFHTSFSNEIYPKKLTNSQTTRQNLNLTQQRYSSNTHRWQPKLSYRKLMKEPKVLLSVERKKIKTSESIRKANEVFSAPKTRNGFRGQKVRSHSFIIQKPQEKPPKKLVIENNHSANQKKQKHIPNFHFNFKYVIEQRKKGKNDFSREQATKQGSNKGYFAFFSSQNFTKYLQKNSYHANSTRLHNRTQHISAKPSTQKSINLKES